MDKEIQAANLCARLESREVEGFYQKKKRARRQQKKRMKACNLHCLCLLPTVSAPTDFSFSGGSSPRLPLRRRLRPFTVLRATDGDSERVRDGPVPRVTPPLTPSETVEIRFRSRGSRKRKQKYKEGGGDGMSPMMKAKAEAPPKKWEDMTVSEKALELYVGEKGLLFWLNKLAYASIFVVIGGWILFRFVGPSLNLYQLDSAPLSPTSIFKT